MKDAWDRFEAVLTQMQPGLLEKLRHPVSEAEIKDAESRLGFSLPHDYANLLRIHNGQLQSAHFLFGRHEFLSLARAMSEWSIWNDLLEEGDFDDRSPKSEVGIQPVWWSQGWLPFAGNGGGDFLCLDMAPSVEGQSGQVIEIFHDAPERTLVARNFRDWFIGLA